MKEHCASIIKNAPIAEPIRPGAEPFKIARDVLESIARESPLHGIVAQALINEGKLQVVE